jgi:hypothetical protein
MATLSDSVYEIVQRLRRVETRQAKWLASIGFDSGTRMPLWHDDGVIELPSRVTSFADIMSVVPEDWDRDYEITILFNGQVMGAVLRP